ncbi:MAG: hypothetical protein JO352_01140 [Chloroflexi bacterium]|nr:hypothetical protein [Chloroflexota bacterium]MBV9595459.1 hypothetical protein [Chloroflexota bacterium]
MQAADDVDDPVCDGGDGDQVVLNGGHQDRAHEGVAEQDQPGNDGHHTANQLPGAVVARGVEENRHQVDDTADEPEEGHP